MWEAVCGSCGTKQNPLLEEIRKTHQARHDEAEIFLNEFKFDDALMAASAIVEQNDLRLQQFATWHGEFSTRVASSRASEHARVEELLGEALAHEEAYDYEAALQTLTQVAPSLKQTTVSGNEDTADVLSDRLTTKQSRLKELEGIVRERVSKRKIAGLFTIVNELLTLKPDRPEVQKLKEQLEKRDTDLLEARDVAIKQATQQLCAQQYAEAVATLNTVSEEVSSEQFGNLKTKASELLNQLNTLRDRITTAVNGNQLKDLLPAVQECLTLKADQDDLVKLKQDLINHEAQMDARNQQIISQAQTHMQQLQFDAAVQILDTIAPEYQTVTTTGLVQQAQQLSEQRQGVLSTASVDLSKKRYKATIKKIRNYLREIAEADIQDPQLQQMLDEAKDKESASIRNKKLIKLGIAAACVVVVLITGVVIKINLDAKAVETAIADGNWETVLELDSDNAEGLRLKAARDKADTERAVAAEKAVKITEILAQGDWETVLALDPGNSEGLRLKDAAEKALAVSVALAQGDWKAVLELDTGNSEGLRLKKEEKRVAVVAALLAKGDWKAVVLIDPENSEGLRMQVAAEKAAEEKAAVVAVALAEGDWKTVLALDPDNIDGLRMQTVAPRTNTSGMTLHFIAAGTFTMGSPKTEEGREDNEHQHSVTITKPFCMQTTEVTQGQWKAMMGTEPWKGLEYSEYVREGANYAATCVNWDDAVEFCKKLSKKEGNTYRLPTEAEWEYACRAGTNTTWSFGNDENVLGDYAWYKINTWDIDEEYAHQVGLEKPNAFGLYGMHGNVWEWCHDVYGEDYYKQSPEKDPTATVRTNKLRGGDLFGRTQQTQRPAVSFRILRGGSWRNDSASTRSAHRGWGGADERNNYYGFRVVRELD